jgi:hypothetical protein
MIFMPDYLQFTNLVNLTSDMKIMAGTYNMKI